MKCLFAMKARGIRQSAYLFSVANFIDEVGCRLGLKHIWGTKHLVPPNIRNLRKDLGNPVWFQP